MTIQDPSLPAARALAIAGDRIAENNGPNAPRFEVARGGFERLGERIAFVGPSREAIRPLLKRFNTLYFYNTQYEGGVCDRNTFCTGSTPAQTVNRLCASGLAAVVDAARASGVRACS